MEVTLEGIQQIESTSQVLAVVDKAQMVSHSPLGLSYLVGAGIQ